MRNIVLLVVLLILQFTSFSQAQMNFIVAPWGDGAGQYGMMRIPGGLRKGPQALCIAEDGTLFVLDTYNQGRVILYSPNGHLLDQIPNQFGSPGYVDMEIEAERYLFLLDLANQAVNCVDTRERTQYHLSSSVLGVSGEIEYMDKELRGRVYLRDSSGRQILLSPESDEKPLLSMQIEETDDPNLRQVKWNNTRITFPVRDTMPIDTIRFLRLLETGILFLSVQGTQEEQVNLKVMSFSPDGNRQKQVNLKPPGFPAPRRPVAVDTQGHVYQLIYTEEDVRILKW